MRIAIKYLCIALMLFPLTKNTPYFPTMRSFSGINALTHVKNQLDFGPRIPSSLGHEQTISYISASLDENGWKVLFQSGMIEGIEITNIIAYWEELDFSRNVVAAHYDTRILSDRDLNTSNSPVPGANDGASGVAILLELANVIPTNERNKINLIFFDMEDNGGIDEYQWIMGSRYFASQLTIFPKSVVILDMVGDKNLNIYFEKSSDSQMSNEIWDIASELGINEFIAEEKYSMLDDHTPFLQLGIPAVDIIDFDYPYWHTTEDTIDKVSAESLEKVGKVILDWIQGLPSE